MDERDNKLRAEAEASSLFDEALRATTAALSEPEGALSPCIGRKDDRIAFPDSREVDSIIAYCRALIFPGLFSDRDPRSASFAFGIGLHVAKLHRLLSRQIRACVNIVSCSENPHPGVDPEGAATEFIAGLPELRHELFLDLEAIYRGDPAAHSPAEIIYSYPAIRAIANHRVAHLLHRIGVPILPRMISEDAHRETGIDIHPAATIGSSFMIDHGTGVVIGETAIIGDRCRIYQGVTLGAKSFPTGEDGTLVKSLPRHPIIGNDVVIYANSTILGRITIGDGCIIGGNIWVTESVPAGSIVLQAHPENSIRQINSATTVKE